MTRDARVVRVVFDTNIVLSALMFPNGQLTPLRLIWQNSRCKPLVSNVTAAEFLRVLTYPKFKLSTADQHELISDYLPYCTSVRMGAKPSLTPACRDPHDVPFLQLALVGKADFLVAGDQDLLSLNRFACPIITAEQFVKGLKK